MQTPDEKTFKNKINRLPAFACSMTRAALGTAVARLCQLAIGTDASLRVQAPEESVIASRHGGIGLCENELAFPAQCRTKFRMTGVEALRFPNHAAPPEAAFKMARVTDTLASLTL
jgi:hypothetical protein